jgi:hypothetical protein
MKKLVVERKKTREEVVSLLLFDVVMFWIEKDVTGKVFGLEHSICSFF